MLRTAQLRILFSLLKPVVFFASSFEVPMRSLMDLLRLSYFERLRGQGLKQREIAQRLNQSERHIRSLEKKIKSDFFSAEIEIGLSREIEDFISTKQFTAEQIIKALPRWSKDDILKELDRLTKGDRLSKVNNGKYSAGSKYVTLSSTSFYNRIDALNHFLEAATGAISERLIKNNSHSAKVKTISFNAQPKDLEIFLNDLEGHIRVKIAQLEEQASFSENKGERYVLGIAAAPL